MRKNTTPSGQQPPGLRVRCRSSCPDSGRGHGQGHINHHQPKLWSRCISRLLRRLIAGAHLAHPHQWSHLEYLITISTHHHPQHIGRPPSRLDGLRFPFRQFLRIRRPYIGVDHPNRPRQSALSQIPHRQNGTFEAQAQAQITQAAAPSIRHPRVIPPVAFVLSQGKPL